MTQEPRNTSRITPQNLNIDCLALNFNKLVNVNPEKLQLDFVSKWISTRKGTSKAI